MSNINKAVHEKGIDNSFNLLKEGYMYITNRSHGFNSDVFETRLLGKKAICMTGEEAAEIFYDNEKFKRESAAPNRVIQTLFGKNGVQTLDEQDHKHRKNMFMSIMTSNRLEELNKIAENQWELAATEWEKMDVIVLYEEVKIIMARIACKWAGVPVDEKNIGEISKELAAMFESPAAFGPPHWQGRNARNQLERWIEKQVIKVREGKIKSPENSALHSFSWHYDLEGKLLDTEVAAVEVINILRPIVAIAIFINFIALALLEHPDKKKKLKSQNEKYAQMFIQEVRRFYPFFPFAAALVKRDFIWNDFKFEEGTLTLLDLYGTNHHPDIWEQPDTFKPERFADWKESPFSFIPQGGGDYFLGHRCAGEWVTVEIMKISLNFLANRLNFEVPNQDLSISMNDLPSIPQIKIILKNTKKTP
ncbi:cytochrome P450 [Oceanobacillus sp. FSL H7-0719]|uniref:cytochrome P450 n=1 Tax=Oceanobacillus sp. FSL H7-0719 TaxID=2954507 RepID=UPI003250B6D0